MILYDGTSPIDWFYDGTMTHYQMDGCARYPQGGRAVLFDNGVGKVYSWKLLDAMCDEYGVDKTDNAQADFDAVVAAMDEPAPDRAEQALEMAESAQQTADEAKTTADTAATSVNEYMDALLGLDATNGTEATDAE